MVVAGLSVWDVTWKIVDKFMMVHGVVLVLTSGKDNGKFNTMLKRLIDWKNMKILFTKKDQIWQLPEHPKACHNSKKKKKMQNGQKPCDSYK